MIKLIHAADFHLDSAFSSLPPEKAARKRLAQRQLLQEFAALCKGAQLVLLPGDLFDSARIYRDTLEALRDCFASIEARIFIAPGNHDYLAPGSPYLTEAWGDNVHIFKKDTIECISLPELNCHVYGAAFTSPESREALLRTFHVENEAVCNLMVLHGDFQTESSYRPLGAADIAGSGLDYLALGHVHTTQVTSIGKTTVAYPGCLTGRGFDECGKKGLLRVEVEKTGCRTEFLPLSGGTYERFTMEAGAHPLEAISALLPENGADCCLRFVLTGQSDPIDLKALTDALADRCFHLELQDRTRPKEDLWARAGEDTLRGHFLAELKAQYASADEETRQTIVQAARLGLALMDGREVSL